MTDMSTPQTPKLSPSEDQTYAGLAQILGIIGILPSLIIWLVFKDRGTKTNALGKEALNFQLTMLLAEIVGYILTFIFVGSLLVAAAWVLRVVFSIIAFTKVQAGEDYRYPVTLRLIK
jgi:uncharacterized Tic20 family protein